MSTCDIETEIIDGYRIDSRTGEVLEYVGSPDFHIDSDDKAEWALEKRGEIEADLAAVRARREAILANLDAMERAAAGKLRAWDFRFGGELEMHVRGRLAGGKAKTWRCPFGSVAIRKVPGGWKWADGGKERALEWARKHKLVPIRSKTVEDVPLEDIKGFIASISMPPEFMYEDDSSQPIRDLAAVVEFASDRETVTIKTGVKA